MPKLINQPRLDKPMTEKSDKGMVKRHKDAMLRAEKGKHGYVRPKPPAPKQGGKKK